jgi:ribosomal protein S12 methylthiotransferase accessory factor
MEMTVSFPGGVAVVADYKGFVIRTDQPVEDGGANSAPSPYDLFIASLGTCAGFYALRFCQQRQLPTAGLELRVALDRNPESGRLDRVAIDLRLPEGFPARYRTAIVRAVDQCSIKRALLDPPEIVITATEMRP